MPLNMYLSGGIPIEELAIDPPVSISEKLTTEPVNNFKRALYQTNKGLLLSPNDALAGLANPFSVAGAAPTANAENQFTLLLNQAGDAAFSIPGGDNSVIQTAVRRTELSKTTNNAAPTSTTAGYDLYTRDSNNVVEKFSFSIDSPESQTPTTLSGFAYSRPKPARTDLSGNTLLDECQERPFRRDAAAAWWSPGPPQQRRIYSPHSESIPTTSAISKRLITFHDQHHSVL